MTEPEKEFEEDSLLPIIGVLAFVFVVILLLSTPSLILGKQISVIDTELSYASGHETAVKTRLDFGSNEHVQAFPREIGDWQSIVFNTSKLAESLRADVMLLRAYGHTYANGTLKGEQVLLFIMQSQNCSSFHFPLVCYPAVGYTIEEEGTEQVAVPNASWAERLAIPETKLGEAVTSRLNERPYFNGSISAKKLVIFKESAGEKGESKRKVVLYFYVKENPFSTDKITMIRVSAHAAPPTNGSHGSEEAALNLTKEFMAEVVPYLFEVRGGEEEEIIAVQLANAGVGGWLAIAALVSVPVAIIFYPRVKKRNEYSK